MKELSQEEIEERIDRYRGKWARVSDHGAINHTFLSSTAQEPYATAFVVAQILGYSWFIYWAGNCTPQDLPTWVWVSSGGILAGVFVLVSWVTIKISKAHDKWQQEGRIR